jgi:hypothetical protein
MLADGGRCELSKSVE